jgi:hypothetical protein
MQEEREGKGRGQQGDSLRPGLKQGLGKLCTWPQVGTTGNTVPFVLLEEDTKDDCCACSAELLPCP